MFVPLAVALQLVGVARIQAAENDGLAVGGHKMVALHADVTGLSKGSGRKQNGGQTNEKNFSHDDNDSTVEGELGQFTIRSVSQRKPVSISPDPHARHHGRDELKPFEEFFSGFPRGKSGRQKSAPPQTAAQIVKCSRR
jgi:hypothetical protein